MIRDDFIRPEERRGPSPFEGWYMRVCWLAFIGYLVVAALSGAGLLK